MATTQDPARLQFDLNHEYLADYSGSRTDNLRKMNRRMSLLSIGPEAPMMEILQCSNGEEITVEISTKGITIYDENGDELVGLPLPADYLALSAAVAENIEGVYLRGIEAGKTIKQLEIHRVLGVAASDDVEAIRHEVDGIERPAEPLS